MTLHVPSSQRSTASGLRDQHHQKRGEHKRGGEREPPDQGALPSVREVCRRIGAHSAGSLHLMRKPWQKRADGPKRLTGHALQRARAALFAREPLCRMCAAKSIVRAATERDHVVPLSKGGTDDDSNIQPLCSPHNAKKMLIDRGFRVRPQVSLDGWPIDPAGAGKKCP